MNDESGANPLTRRSTAGATITTYLDRSARLSNSDADGLCRPLDLHHPTKMMTTLNRIQPQIVYLGINIAGMLFIPQFVADRPSLPLNLLSNRALIKARWGASIVATFVRPVTNEIPTVLLRDKLAVRFSLALPRTVDHSWASN